MEWPGCGAGAGFENGNYSRLALHRIGVYQD